MVISGVPQGTLLGPMLFLVLMSDINQNIEESKIISFADDTRLYTPIYSVDDCDSLQSDLQSVYDWAHSNNMFFSSFFFFRKNYLLLSCATSVRPSVCPSVEIISFRGNSLPNRPIELKIGLNVREGVVHVRKA